MKQPDRHPRALRPELTPDFIKTVQAAEENASAEGGRRNWPDLVHPLLADCHRLGASDIHVEPHHTGARARLRVDGTVWDVADLSTSAGRALVNQFKALAGLDPISRFTPQEAHAQAGLAAERLDLRLALAPTLDRETMAIRLLDPRRLDRSISSLGLSSRNLETLTGWLEDVSGMFLTTGPTGSGKTTTLYALLQHLKGTNRVVLSLEDPVEYQIDGISQIQVDELHGLNFAEGIKSLLRHDPDFMMLGEIRDGVSAHTAVNAAISGRVLLSTMHSRDAVGAITALRNWGLSEHEIAESVSVIVAQRLVRRVCEDCRERRELTQAEKRWFREFGLEAPAHVWEGRGCGACRQLGYRGRTGVFELWKLDSSDYQMILRRLDEHRLRMHLFEKGHSSLLQEAWLKVKEGVTTPAELRRVAAGSFSSGEGLAGEESEAMELSSRLE